MHEIVLTFAWVLFALVVGLLPIAALAWGGIVIGKVVQRWRR